MASRTHAAQEQRPPLGTRIPALNAVLVSRATLALFAGASGDHNPIHIDLDAARKAGLPDVIAHGMLVEAWLGRMVTSWVPQSCLLSLSARFVGITQVGDTMHCEGEVVEHLVERGVPAVRVKLEARTQHGDVRVTGEAVVALQHDARERMEQS